MVAYTAKNGIDRLGKGNWAARASRKVGCYLKLVYTVLYFFSSVSQLSISFW